MRKIFLLAMLLLGATAARANDVYLSQSGGGTGASCGSALPVAYFSTSMNWVSTNPSGTMIGPGTTVHGCGALTGIAGGTLLTFQGSGTPGFPVKFLFEAGATMSAPYWNTTNGAITCAGKNYITVDGGTNGVLQATANGTALANHQSSQGIYFSGCSNVVIQNLFINNIYVQQALSSDLGGKDSNSIFFMNGSNNLITHCKFNFARGAIQYFFTSAQSNVEESFNTISNIESTLVMASAASGAVMTGVKIHDNNFVGGNYFWDTPANSMHHNMLHFWAQTGGGDGIKNVEVYNNAVYGVMGNDQSYFNQTNGSHITSVFYMEEINGTASIYNNTITLLGNANLNSTDNGMIFCKDTQAASICKVYNNTFVQQGQEVAFETSFSHGGHVFENNVVSNVKTALFMPSNQVAADYNVYSGTTQWSTSTNSFAQWQSGGQDKHGKNGVNLNLSPTYQLLSGSAAIGAGANLSSLGLAALLMDKAGASRPAAPAPWDAGAYNSGSAPPPPPGITISISPATTSVLTGGTVQFTDTVTGTTSTAVAWTTNIGSISSTGLLSAPVTAGSGTVTVTLVADTSKTATATVTVTSVPPPPPPPPPPGAAFSITPSSLVQFKWTMGGAAPAPQTLHVADTAPAGIKTAFTSTVNQPWLLVSPASAQTSQDEVVSINTSAITAAGTYTGQVTFTGPLSDSPRTFPVTLVVSGTTPPPPPPDTIASTCTKQSNGDTKCIFTTRGLTGAESGTIQAGSLSGTWNLNLGAAKRRTK